MRCDGCGSHVGRRVFASSVSPAARTRAGCTCDRIWVVLNQGSPQLVSASGGGHCGNPDGDAQGP
eukprot:46090-Prorocentrum_minimum.AAC.1